MAPLAVLAVVLAAAAPAFAQKEPELRPRSEVAAYLATVNDARKFSKFPDDDKKLAADAELAVRAYRYLRGGAISTKDAQTFASAGFFLRTGNATFNPDESQTKALKDKLDGDFGTGTLLQVDLIYEALVATGGNLTMAFGSLAQLFCAERAAYVPKVADMMPADGKNYYRYAGAFIGLHGWATRAAGMSGAYANIGGNPVVYAGYEVYDAWKSFFTTGKMKGADTLRTLGPEGNGNIADKGGQLQLGFNAAESLRGKF